MTPESIERWTSEWAITPKQKFDFSRLLAEVFEEAGQLYGFSYNSMTIRGLILTFLPSTERPPTSTSSLRYETYLQTPLLPNPPLSRPSLLR